MFKRYLIFVLSLLTAASAQAQLTPAELIAKHKEAMSEFSRGIDEKAPVIMAEGIVEFIGIELPFKAYLKDSMLRFESEHFDVIINDSISWSRGSDGDHTFDASFELGFQGLIRNRDQNFLDLLENGYKPVHLDETLLLDSIKAYNLIVEKEDKRMYCYFDRDSYYFLGYKTRKPREQRYYLNHQVIGNYLWPRTFIYQSYQDESFFRISAYTETGAGSAVFELSAEAKEEYEKQFPFDHKPELISGNRLLYYQGLALGDKGEFKKAIEKFNLALDKNPDNERLLSIRAVSYAALSNYEKAMADLNRAIEVAPLYASTYFKMGRIKEHFGDVDGALEAFKKAASLAPGNSNAYEKIGSIYHLEKKNYKRAHEAFDKALEIDPFFAEGHYFRGVAAMVLGNDRAALADLMKAESLGLNESRLFGAMGMVLSNLEEQEASADAFRKSIALDPSNLRDKVSLVMTLSGLGRHNELVELATEVLSEDPNDMDILFYRSISLFKLDRFAEAKEGLEILIKEPETPNYLWFYKGYSNEMLGASAEALQDYTRYLETEEWSVVYLRRGFMYIEAEKETEGCKDFTKADQLGLEAAKEALFKYCDR
ncbi:MAG: tetratricopeptide repeat protein [Roseivirga sp.]|nr:tetratricopeptide repeat protein [Roseivirga sp.]